MIATSGSTPLDLGMVALVLLAAVLHASWNALVKAGKDRLVTFATIMGTGVALGLLALPFVPLPHPAAWPYLGGSILSHGAYYFFLLQAYRFGDLSHTYPIARGFGPLLVALLSVPLIGEALTPGESIAIAGICIGIGSLAFAHGLPPRATSVATGHALATGIFIAAYTIIDGLGVRQAGNPLSYIVWVNLLDGLPLLAMALWLRRERLAAALPVDWWRNVGGGIIAAAAYGIALWAMSLAMLAQVAALRETSVIFAAIIGAVLLGEPFGKRRIAAAAVVAAGVVGLNLF